MPPSGISNISMLLIALALLSTSTVAKPWGQSTTAAKLSSAGQEKNPPSKSGTAPSEYGGLKLDQVKRLKGWCGSSFTSTALQAVLPSGRK